MVSLTLSIPNKLKEEMEEFKYINWSEIARSAILSKLRILEKMERLLSKSTLGEEEAVKYGRMIKKRQWEKTKEMLK
jgi:hypothetical protein